MSENKHNNGPLSFAWDKLNFNNTSIYSLTPSYPQILMFMLNLMMMMMMFSPILHVELTKIKSSGKVTEQYICE